MPDDLARVLAELPPRSPDPEALLVALVLAPSTYPRNRFFSLYRDARLKRVRRRASELRTLVRDLARREGAVAQVESIDRSPDGTLRVRYRIDSLTLRVEARLSRVEAAALEVALARALDRPPPPEAQALVDELLVRLT